MAAPPMAAPARRAAGVEVLDLVHAVPAEVLVVLREEAPAPDDVRLVALFVVDLVPDGGRGPAGEVGLPVAFREAADVEGLGGAGRELRRDLVLLGGDGVDHLEPGWPGQGPPQDVRPLLPKTSRSIEERY